MRITIALGPYFPVPPILGGAIETVQLALAEEFATRGHQVTVISRRFPGLANEEVRAGVRHLRVKSRDAPRSRIGFRLYDLLYSWRVARLLPPSDMTVTHSFFLPCVLPRRRAGRLYVHVARYPKGQMWLYRHVDRLQTVSASLAAEIRRQTPAMADRLVVIPEPLTGALAAPMPLASLADPRPRTILYIGRIAHEKGVHALVEAFAMLAKGPLSGYRLQIVGPHETRQGGDGADYLNQLKQLAAPAGDAVIFSGFIPYGNSLRRVLEIADIFVYPSLAERGESFGLAPLEAMAAGCRVVVSDLACFREYLDPDRNGYVFDHRQDTARTLAATLTAILREGDSLPMREAAVATAGRFQLGPIADQFLADFNLLLSKPAEA
jgi:glycosyltransferase involved in cell wall biosynthesis